MCEQRIHPRLIHNTTAQPRAADAGRRVFVVNLFALRGSVFPKHLTYPGIAAAKGEAS